MREDGNRDGNRDRSGDRNGNRNRDRDGQNERRSDRFDRKPRVRPPRWTEEELEKLKTLANNQKETNSKINWEVIGQQLNKPAHRCYNKYIMLTEKPWTDREEKTLLKYWRKFTGDKFDFAKLAPVLEGHTIRGMQFQLEHLSREFNCQCPRYEITDEQLKVIE